jgi:hypothetical protein
MTDETNEQLVRRLQRASARCWRNDQRFDPTTSELRSGLPQLTTLRASRDLPRSIPMAQPATISFGLGEQERDHRLSDRVRAAASRARAGRGGSGEDRGHPGATRP